MAGCIPNITSISNISGGGRSGIGGVLKKAYLFDGTDDYIAGDTTIGRTGYDMNVSGNVSTGSDADGSYFWINGNRDGAALTGTSAQIGPVTTPAFTQDNSFSLKVRVKVNNLPPGSQSGFFGSGLDASIYTDSSGNDLIFTLRGSSNVTHNQAGAFTLGVQFDAYLVYDATQSKFFCYYSTGGASSTLLNVGGTTGPATFTTNQWYIGDAAIGSGNNSSCNKYIYHAAIRNVALSQAEIDADIALGNTTKTDSRIVAYYIPENLQYNTQYMSNPKALDQSNRVKTGATAVTANTTTAPDGTTTADQVAISGTATQGVSGPSTAITGSTLASKTLIVKAFVKVAAGTAAFRLGIGHTGVADYYSSNQTATTTRQEFTFTQTLTSSSSGTGFSGGVFNDSTATNPTLEVRNVRVFVTNETLRDESPNIGGYMGWKQKVISYRCKPNTDSTDTPSANTTIAIPFAYSHIRTTNNLIRIRYDSRLGSRERTYTLGNGFRNKVHFCGVQYRDGSNFQHSIYINGVLQAGSSVGVAHPSIPASGIGRANCLAASWSGATGFYSGYIRDPRIYTFTGSFTDADALRIYQGLEPSSAGITKYLHRRPTPGEAGTTAIDHSGNSRTGTLTGGTTRAFLSGS